uniref:Cation-transporting P-type ATPase C-terminal domain-containing protein n=1 Tax=Strombidium inclinatum TaxID=197538 RepID=A0A7S3IHV2_9SPIT
MDILGAIAIGTEPYKRDTAEAASKSNRISRRDKIMLPEMWRQVLVQALYQMLVMIFLMYFGEFVFFDDSFNLITTPLRDGDGNPTNRMVLDTMCFHCFILMNMFNQINCRVIDGKELNVFKTLFNNPMFWIVFIGEMVVQQLMINASNSTLGSALLGTAPMSVNLQITCWAIGAFSLVVNVILKQIPIENFSFTRHIDLESENSDEFINKYMAKAEAGYKNKMDSIMKAGE